jgi:2-polyprenyl-3-methyl-5-hydroxy-6-metoxy-1,4-benzoquinol methylase
VIKAPGWRWQDEAAGGGLMDEVHPQRRVIGIHDIRFDGISDLLLRAKGCSVLDVGCNRGHVCYDFVINGARLVHGCDIYGPGIQTARQWFAELPHVQSKFEVVNLEEGPAAVSKAFGIERYDIILLLGTSHKLKRVVTPESLSHLVRHLGERTLTYFAWNGYFEDLEKLDDDLTAVGLRQIHISELAMPGQPAAIWRR